MGCCGSAIKYLLFIFNFIFVFQHSHLAVPISLINLLVMPIGSLIADVFPPGTWWAQREESFLCGIALLAVGSFMIADQAAFSEVADKLDVVVKAPAVVLIVLGVLIFLISFLGCCGAIKESKCMLIAFAASLGIIFIIQLVIGIYALVALSDDNISTTLTKIFKERTPESIKMFEALENSFECCGVDGKFNYDEQHYPVSDTCCQTPKCEMPPIYWPSGCSSKFGAWLTNSGKYLGGVAVGLSIVEVIGIIFAIRQARAVDPF